MSQLEAELREFVQLRNDAAHGLLHTLPGRSILERNCLVIRALIYALTSFVHNHLLSRRTAAGRMFRIGKVSAVFPRSGAFIVRVQKGTEIVRGMSVHFLSNGMCDCATIQSIQVDDVAVERTTAEVDGFEVGLACPLEPRRNAEVFGEC